MTTIIGIDTGGTFSDVVSIDGEGRFEIFKSPSTPDDFARGVFDVLDLARSQSGLDETAYQLAIGALALGTTIATNTVVTRSGAGSAS